SVQVKGKNASTLTDEDGTFSLSLDVGDVLQISYVGYTPEEVTVSSRNPITVLLMAANNDLDEVVVIGYGTDRKRDLTGAVGSVNGDDIRQVPVRTAAQALTVKVSGVRVIDQCGATGADVMIS